MIIECHNCEAKVDAKVLCGFQAYSKDMPFLVWTSLVKCSVCGQAILAGQERLEVAQDEFEWSQAFRLWPDPQQYLDWSIPQLVRGSFEEAEVCYKSKAYSACAVMCGRAIEGILVTFEAEGDGFANGLKKLREMNVIDDRLFEWGDELRRIRNLGAHATDQRIDREDAKDVLDFTRAICEYVFVLTTRFERFKDRQSSAEEE